MKFRKLIGALGLAFVAAHAFAAPALVPGGVSIIEDDDKEYVVDRSGALKTSGSLAVGDVLHAVVRFNNVLDSSNTVFDALGTGNALYGISAIEVTSISGGIATFGPNATFAATYGAGALAALFTGPTDLDMGCSTIAACETAATSGLHWMTVGLKDADDFWVASGVFPYSITTDLATLAGLNATTKVAVANYALSILKNDTGYAFNQQYCATCAAIPGGDDMVDIIGSGDILGGAGLAGGYVARSDFDFELLAVPEPASLALLGASLLAAGVAGGRRRKVK